MECSGVNASIGKSEGTLAIFLAIFIAAIVPGAIRPCFDTLPMLLVLEPVADISGSIGVPVSTMSVSLIIEPHSLIDVTNGVDQCAHSISLVVLPHAFIPGGVWPNLHSMPVLLPVDALASVSGSICVGRWAHIRKFVVWLVALTSRFCVAIHHLAFASAPKLAVLLGRLRSILDLKLLTLLINVSDIHLLRVSLLLLDSNLPFIVGVLAHAVCGAVSHIYLLDRLSKTK